MFFFPFTVNFQAVFGRQNFGACEECIPLVIKTLPFQYWKYAFEKYLLSVLSDVVGGQHIVLAVWCLISVCLFGFFVRVGDVSGLCGDRNNENKRLFSSTDWY